jgi:hypothetical protein
MNKCSSRCFPFLLTEKKNEFLQNVWLIRFFRNSGKKEFSLTPELFSIAISPEISSRKNDAAEKTHFF